MLTNEMNILQAMRDALDALDIEPDGADVLSWHQLAQMVKAGLNLKRAIIAYEQQIEEMEKAEPMYPAPATPEGWQLVPKEPTEEMVEAGEQAVSRTMDANIAESMNGLGGSKTIEMLDAETKQYVGRTYSSVLGIYKAMLSAAPEYKP